MPRTPEPSGREPDFVIAGAMRCGTTSLFRWMGHHPQIFAAGAKELHYFDMQYDRGHEWYRDQFAAAVAGQVCGEATPAYLYLPWARERMANDLPRARFIVTLRNPADRAWSHFWHNRERGVETMDFEDALAAEPARLKDKKNAARYSYAARGRYAEQLDDLFATVARERVLVLIFENEFLADPVSAFRRVTAFLNVDDLVPPEVGQRVNEARHIRSPRVRSLAKHLPKAVRDAVGRLNSSPARGYPMPADQRRRLISFFSAENDRLAKLLGIDMASWAG